MLPHRTKLLAGLALLAVAGLITLRFSPPLFSPPGPKEPAVAPPPLLPAPEVETWKEAARKVEEPRGEGVGRGAKVHVPEELRHYADRRRFLAVQVAKTREHELELPHDWAELAYMIRDGELVRVEALGEHHILYGVGGSAEGGPFTHFDRTTATDIPLYDGWADFKDAEGELRARAAEAREEAADRRARIRKLSRKYRTKRRNLLREATSLEAQAKGLAKRADRTAYFYDDYDRRRSLVGEHRLLHDLAANFGGRQYDLDTPLERRRLKGRLLSYLRPEARDMMVEIAAGYSRRFGRRLPVSSLVRTLRYQREVGRTNRNATRIAEPPHATGLAFDLHYGHMTAAEQEHVMEELARREREGRLEALRENLNHWHVFVFADGKRPPETLVARSLPDVRPDPKVKRAASRSTARKAVSSRAGAKKAASRQPSRTRALRR